MVQLKTDGLAMAVPVVSTAPTSTTNMTGFLNCTRGSSLRKVSGADFHSILGSSSPPPIRFGWPLLWGAGVPPESIVVTDISVQSFCERPEGEGGEVREPD